MKQNNRAYKVEGEKRPVLTWGVFRFDCYKLPELTKLGALIKTFENYKDALSFSRNYESSAIHLTEWRKP